MNRPHISTITLAAFLFLLLMTPLTVAAEENDDTQSNIFTIVEDTFGIVNQIPGKFDLVIDNTKETIDRTKGINTKVNSITTFLECSDDDEECVKDILVEAMAEAEEVGAEASITSIENANFNSLSGIPTPYPGMNLCPTDLLNISMGEPVVISDFFGNSHDLGPRGKGETASRCRLLFQWPAEALWAHIPPTTPKKAAVFATYTGPVRRLCDCLDADARSESAETLKARATQSSLDASRAEILVNDDQNSNTILTNDDQNRETIIDNDDRNRDLVVTNDNENTNLVLELTQLLADNALRREIQNNLGSGSCESWMYMPRYLDADQQIRLDGERETVIDVVQAVIDEAGHFGIVADKDLRRAQEDLDTARTLDPEMAQEYCRMIKKAYQGATVRAN